MFYLIVWNLMVIFCFSFTYYQDVIKNKYLGVKYFIVLGIIFFSVSYWIAYNSQNMVTL